MPKPWPARSLAVGLVVLALSASACDATGSAASGSPEPTPPTDLSGTNWVLVSVGGANVAESPPAGLAFETGARVSGSTGCNSFGGTFSIDGSSLAFGPLATTKRGCERPLMDQERAVLDGLAGAAGWAVDDAGRLHLTGATELVFAPVAR